jgi:hypothetical protein
MPIPLVCYVEHNLCILSCDRGMQISKRRDVCVALSVGYYMCSHEHVT